MPKILEEFYKLGKYQPFKLTQGQKELFKQQIEQYDNDFDTFCYAKEVIRRAHGKYTSVVNMPLQKYLDKHAPEYGFDLQSQLMIPYIFWRNVYEQVFEDSDL